jgi:hypothetical protein
MNRKLSPSKIKMNELNHVGNGWGWFVDIESCESYVTHKQHVYVGYKKMNDVEINGKRTNLSNPKEFYKINRNPTTSTCTTTSCTTTTTTTTTTTKTHEVIIQKKKNLTHVTFCLTCITIIIIFIIVAIILSIIK